jgi:catechol 2,3-dioxygenase-like lactoylglutathione lyase family enzyme
MQIRFASILVEDLDHALRFCTATLGFRKMADLPFEQSRWVTVVSPDGIEGVELQFRPVSAFPTARTYQKALFDAGIPIAGFITRDIGAEFQRLATLGVRFRGKPESMGPITAVLFDDTCGNLINLVQPAV